MSGGGRVRTCYVAYPIDFRGEEVGWLDLVRDAVDLLLARGVGVYDPGEAWSVAEGLPPGSEIKRVNDAAVDTCDALLAFLPDGVGTVGVPMEIERAIAGGKVVAVISNRTGWSLAGKRQWGWDEEEVIQAVSWLSEQPGKVGWGENSSERLRWTGEATSEPRRAYADDAGFDLVVSEGRVVGPGEFVDVPCGVRVELPSWTWGLITGRSSTLRKRGLLVSTGIIDTGWRGPLFAGVWNLTQEEVKIDEGERIAQLIVLANTTRLLEAERVEELSEHPRGWNGFGSSGA